VALTGFEPSSGATEELAAGWALAWLAGHAAHRVKLLLARRVDEAIAAASAAQLDVAVSGWRHMAILQPAG
jgi:hypothetical protein